MKNRKCQVISIVNFKGGVGKSTVTLNLGYELSRNGYKVLLVDFDAQGNLTRFSNILEKGIAIKSDLIEALNLIMKNEEPSEDPIYTINANMDIIPCSVMKEKWMNDCQTALVREKILKRYLDLVKTKFEYDFILIDNAPSINIDLQNSLTASDFYLIVAEPDIASLDGTNAVLNVIDLITQHVNQNLKPLGLLFNKYEGRVNLHKQMPAGFENRNLHVFEQYLPKSADAQYSEFFGISIRDYKKNSKLADAYSNFTLEFIKEVNHWEEKLNTPLC